MAAMVLYGNPYYMYMYCVQKGRHEFLFSFFEKNIVFFSDNWLVYKIIYFNYQSHITLHTTRPGPVSKQPCLTGMGRVGLCTGYAGTGLTARSRTRKDCVAWPWGRPVTNDALSACREPTWIWNRETVAANLKKKNMAVKFCSAQSQPDACIGRPRSSRRTAPPRPRRGLRFRFQDPRPPRV